MLFAWLSPAILAVEGASLNSSTFESAYFEKYADQLEPLAVRTGVSTKELCTAYGKYQILGENLVRYFDYGRDSMYSFITNEAEQDAVARQLFYIMVKTLIQRRGFKWTHYLFSLWNSGIVYNDSYSRSIEHFLKGSKT